MTQARIVLSTAANLDEAQRLAHALVEARLAACVNLIPNLTSIYRWEGKIEQSQEILLLIKTAADQLAALEAELHRLHSYQVPEFLVIAIPAGSQPYLGWASRSPAAAPPKIDPQMDRKRIRHHLRRDPCYSYAGPFPEIAGTRDHGCAPPGNSNSGNGMAPMRYLYVVFVLCIVALVWAIVGVTRHIRRHEAATVAHTEMPDLISGKRRD